MIKIDNNKCTFCGNCLDACTAGTLTELNKEIVQIKPESCVICGHCASVCSVNAISSHEKSRLQFVSKKLSPEKSELEKLLLTKRSIRDFSDKIIDKNLLEKIIYYAEKAPSSSNKRQREYIIITDKSKILELEKAVIGKFNSLKFLTKPFILNTIKLFSKKMAHSLSKLKVDIADMNNKFNKKEYKIFRDAPAIIIYIAPTKSVQAKDDCVIAQQYSMLHAESIGIGSCIIGYAQYTHKTVEKVLNIEKDKTIFAVSTFGYAKYEYKNEIQYTNVLNAQFL